MTTRLGQAQTRMEEYSELYRAPPTAQSLPSLSEYLQMRWWLRPNMLNETQQRMLAHQRVVTTPHGPVPGRWAGRAGWDRLGGQQILERRLRDREDRKEADTLVVAELPEAVQRIQLLRPEQAQLWRTLRSYYDEATIRARSDCGLPWR